MSLHDLKQSADGEIIEFHDVMMNCNRFEIQIKDTPVYLTFTEFKLLEYLIRNMERAVSREELLKEIWAIPESIETRATDDMVKRLRKKLKQSGADVSIITVRGYGFMIANKQNTKLVPKKLSIAKSGLNDAVKALFEQSISEDLTLRIKATEDHYEIKVLLDKEVSL